MDSGSRSTRIAHARDLLAMSREEVGRADGKASTLLAGAGVMLGLLFTGGWQPPGLRDAGDYLLWAGTGGVVVALALLAGAVYPRISAGSPASPGRLSYFGDLARLPDAADVRGSLAGDEDAYLRFLAEQAQRISILVERKYALIRWAIVALSCGFIGGAAGVLVHRLG